MNFFDSLFGGDGGFFDSILGNLLVLLNPILGLIEAFFNLFSAIGEG